MSQFRRYHAAQARAAPVRTLVSGARDINASALYERGFQEVTDTPLSRMFSAIAKTSKLGINYMLL